jgi:hypothetical protein
MTIASLLRYRKALPRCCHYQVSPPFELDITIALCFPLANFGQRTTSPSLPSVFSSPSNLSLRLRRQPPEQARKKIRRRNQAGTADHGLPLGVDRIASLDSCRDVPLHHRQNLSALSFSCAHSSPASIRTALRQ